MQKMKNSCYKSSLTNMNPHLKTLFNSQNNDFYYHLGLGSNDEIVAQLCDVKFVLLSGSRQRAHLIAKQVQSEFKNFSYHNNDSKTQKNCDYSKIIPIGCTERYELYKIGNILSASHGMGMGSISILLHELTKMLIAAEATNFVYMRIGTSGGIGLQPGTVVISDSVVSDTFDNFYSISVLGEVVQRYCKVDQKLAGSIVDCNSETTNKRIQTNRTVSNEFEVVLGKTMTCSTFYESQCRLDGSICEFSEEDKQKFLEKCIDFGIKNIEMESICLAAFCTHLNIPSAMICVTLVDRVLGDQICLSKENYNIYSLRAVRVALN